MQKLALALAVLWVGSLLADTMEDPVMATRSMRAAAQGISEGDLPPLPKGVIEPPPLPSPQTNPKDLGRTIKAQTKGKVSKRAKLSHKKSVKGAVKKAKRIKRR